MPKQPKPAASVDDLVKQSPVLGVLFILFFLNWFVFAAINVYLHGDALDTLPSKDGFVVTSHGQQSPVSEAVWLFSLLYSGATLLLTPAIGIAAGVRMFRGQLREVAWYKRLFIGGFLLVWCLGWYTGIGSSLYHSFEDWRHLKRAKPGIRRTEVNRAAWMTPSTLCRTNSSRCTAVPCGWSCYAKA